MGQCTVMLDDESWEDRLHTPLTDSYFQDKEYEFPLFLRLVSSLSLAIMCVLCPQPTACMVGLTAQAACYAVQMRCCHDSMRAHVASAVQHRDDIHLCQQNTSRLKALKQPSNGLLITAHTAPEVSMLAVQPVLKASSCWALLAHRCKQLLGRLCILVLCVGRNRQ